MLPTSSPTPPLASLHDVRVQYPATTALQDIDLQIQPGQVLALLGRNGAGKSTAIAVLLGLRRPDGGQARWLPLQQLPQIFSTLAPLWPTWHAAQLAMPAVGFSAGPVALHAAAMLAVTVLFTALAARRLRRVG